VNIHHFQFLEEISSERLRDLAAVSGWLIETNEVLLCGFGPVDHHYSCPDGLDGDQQPAGIFAGFPTDSSRIVAFGSVPFRRNEAFELVIPRYVISRNSDGLTEVLSTVESLEDLLTILDTELPVHHEIYNLATTSDPSTDEYSRMVASAVREIRNGVVEKVVLARRVSGSAGNTIHPHLIVQSLHQREPRCTLYAFPLSGQRRFVGASPELLVAAVDREVSCHPLAGTIALSHSDDEERYADWLLGSTKNLNEHAYVVDDIVRRLDDICFEVEAETTPSVVLLKSVAHLGTWIRAQRGTTTTAFDLLRALHPTPAVAGIPQQEALDIIDRLEPMSRGHYAGAVGYVDNLGDGQWWVAIRGLTIDDENFEAWAGAGIVADSDPLAEKEETSSKLASVLVALSGQPL